MSGAAMPKGSNGRPLSVRVTAHPVREQLRLDGHFAFAFTDGLVEARSPAGEAFGSERLRAID